MSICRLRNTSNALMLQMSGEQIRLQVPLKLPKLIFAETDRQTDTHTFARTRTHPDLTHE